MQGLHNRIAQHRPRLSIDIVSNPESTQSATMALAELADNQDATVVAVQAADTSMTPDMLRRLIEIGFLPGERVRIVARGLFGGTPLAVRVGTATFALRRLEAQCVRVSTASSGL
jgi:ferrous iron transport protein A